jgi:hypothetical protein
VVRVLGVVERDNGVGEREVQQGEETGILREGDSVGDRDCLRDLVPVVLDRRAPEAAD